MQSLVGHSFDKIIYVNAANETEKTNNKELYEQFTKAGVCSDLRNYKTKTHFCTKCMNQDTYKVQAEVDIAIAVKMIKYS